MSQYESFPRKMNNDYLNNYEKNEKRFCLSKMEIAFLTVIAVIVAIATVAVLTTFVHASTLSLEAPPPPDLQLNGPAMNLSADDEDRDISIDPTSPILFMNGTQTIPTAGATDVDINEFPPIGVTVMIQNDTITVTKNQVQIVDPTNDLIAVDSGDDSESSSDGGEE